MIGHIADAYRKGRLDARAGVRIRPTGSRGYLRRIYVLGWNDEAARMERLGRLPQLALDFFARDGSEADIRPPQMPQDRRSTPRTAPHALDLMELGGLD